MGSGNNDGVEGVFINIKGIYWLRDMHSFRPINDAHFFSNMINQTGFARDEKLVLDPKTPSQKF